MLEQNDVIYASGLQPPLYAALADVVSSEFGNPTILLVPDKQFNTAISDCETCCGNRALPFPAWNVLPYAHKYPDAEITATRINSVWKYLQKKNPVLIATPLSLLWFTLPPDIIEQHSTQLTVGMDVAPSKLGGNLSSAGYRREPLVEFLRTFARRGEVLDFFSPAHPNPIRIEFLGNKIDEIRLFSTRDQRSIAKIKGAQILPCIEWLTMDDFSADELMSHLHDNARQMMSRRELEELTARIALDRHFPGEIWFAPIFKPSPISPMSVFMQKNPMLIVVEPERCSDEIDDFVNSAMELYERVSWEDFSPLPPEFVFPHVEYIKKMLVDCSVLSPRIKSIYIREIPTDIGAIDFDSRQVIPSHSPTELLSQMEALISAGTVFVSVSSDRQRERIGELLGGRIPVPIRRGAVSRSFSMPDDNIAVISGDEILGFSRTMFTPERYHQGRAMLAHYGLEQGDLVVHADYGIAKFMGIKPLEIEGRTTELLQLSFAGNERLYVPIENFYLINPYLGSSSASRLSKLGGKKWANVKAKTRAKIFELAGELIRIYAMRQVKNRPPMNHIEEWEHELKKSFPYEETDDQRRAIKDVLSNLEDKHPMDRLLCGDVGFGKTEVAIRAAVRAVSQGYQIAMLVPTTILAVQHTDTFRERLSKLPLRIEMMCRFTPPKKTLEIAHDITDGKVDIVIGTHKLLSDKILSLIHI